MFLQKFLPQKHLINFIIYVILQPKRCWAIDVYIERWKEREGERKDSCQFFDQNFLPCFLCKQPTTLFQNKNGIFQHKNQTIN